MFPQYLVPNMDQQDGEFGIGGIEGGELAYMVILFIPLDGEEISNLRFRLNFTSKCNHFLDNSPLSFRDSFFDYLFPNMEQQGCEFGIGGMEGGEFTHVVSFIIPLDGEKISLQSIFLSNSPPGITVFSQYLFPNWEQRDEKFGIGGMKGGESAHMLSLFIPLNGEEI